MIIWLETDTFANKDISSAVAVGAYTATADMMLLFDLSLSGIAGDGDYVIYLKRQIGGAGDDYIQLPRTTMTALVGETAIGGQSRSFSVKSGDVLTLYVDGLAADTSVDTTVRWYAWTEIGPGAISWTLYIKHLGVPIDGVDVWVTTDLAGTNIVARGYTDTLGKLTVYLDAGTYYAWKSLGGYTFTNPEAFTVV